MKRLFLILGLAMLVASCGGEKAQTASATTEAPKRHGWDGYGVDLYGDVAQVVGTQWQAADKFGEVVKDKLDDKSVWIFDERGNVVSHTDYDSNGKLANKGIYKYDNEGRCVDYSKYGSDGKLRLKTIFRYDDKGNCIEEAWYDADGRLSDKTVCKFNDNGKCIEEAEYDANGRLWSVYKYNDKGNPIENVDYNPDGKVERKYVYKYDSKGNYKGQVYYNSDGKVEGKTIRKYNDNGNPIEDVGYNSDGKVEWRYTYIHGADGKLAEKLFEGVDDAENIKKENCVQFKRDSHGNVTERRDYEYKGEIVVPKSIVEYEITYR